MKTIINLEMYNLHGEFKSSIIPFFCSWSKQVIRPSDKRYAVFNIRILKKGLIFSNKVILFVLSSRIRSKGLSDLALEVLMSKY